MKLDGTGEEHVVDSQGNDAVTNFTIDRQHGNAGQVAENAAHERTHQAWIVAEN